MVHSIGMMSASKRCRLSWCYYLQRKKKYNGNFYVFWKYMDIKGVFPWKAVLKILRASYGTSF